MRTCIRAGRVAPQAKTSRSLQSRKRIAGTPEFAIRSTHKLHVLYRRLVPYPYAFLRGQIVGNSKAPLIASLKRLGMRARNPPALPAGIADQQPAVPCVFDCDFLALLHGQFPCRIIREDPGEINSTGTHPSRSSEARHHCHVAKVIPHNFARFHVGASWFSRASILPRTS